MKFPAVVCTYWARYSVVIFDQSKSEVICEWELNVVELGGTSPTTGGKKLTRSLLAPKKSPNVAAGVRPEIAEVKIVVFCAVLDKGLPIMSRPSSKSLVEVQ